MKFEGVRLELLLLESVEYEDGYFADLVCIHPDGEVHVLWVV